MSNTLRGIIRLALIFTILPITTLIILATAWIPIRIRGVRLCAWPVTIMVRSFFLILNIHYTCTDPARLRQHQGFVFPNHISYVDILMMVNLLPMRFLSSHKVRSWPFVGWIAIAIGTLFVDRQDKNSRHGARLALTDVERYPPIVLFPEGGIIHDEHLISPFRFGAFEIVTQGNVPFIPCVIYYDREEIVAWGDESVMAAIWRLASRSGPIQAELIPLPAVYPRPDDSPQQLAEATQEAMSWQLRQRKEVALR